MENKTLKALKESITSWKTKKIKKVEDLKGSECPLCRALDYTCDLCPVKCRTGFSHCIDTPWEKLNNYLMNSLTACDPKIIEKYRQEEIAFLESLLPEEEAI